MKVLKNINLFLLVVMILFTSLMSQERKQYEGPTDGAGDKAVERIGYMEGNNIRLQFRNTTELSDWGPGTDPFASKWPNDFRGSKMNDGVGLLIGAAVGGAAGAYIGNYMDKQAAEIERDIEGAKVERVGEGIKITFDSGILFDVDQAELKDQHKSELAELAVILNKYEDTNMLLAGHTDSTGSEEYNQGLSERRAQSVASYLGAQNVSNTRVSVEGYGQSQPVASNDTAAGRAQNRRVEVAIWANEKLKKYAKENT